MKPLKEKISITIDGDVLEKLKKVIFEFDKAFKAKKRERNIMPG